MSNFNVTVDETANKVTINEDTGSIIVRGVGVQGPEGAAGGAPDWGDIGGTLSDQTDLQTALNAKQDLDSQLTSVAGLSYAGNSLKVVRVNAGENGFELATQTSGVTDHTALTNIGTNTHSQIDTHIANTSNPHSVIASQVGLGNVDNTSDANKPVSTAQQTAIDAKVSDTAYNASSWDDVTTIAPSKNAIRDKIESLASSIVTDHTALSNIGTNTHVQIDTHIVNTSNPHSVTATQVGLGNVDNTSDLNKPVSTATQIALDLKVDENAPITGATKTKITYDTKGLVTSGADATTADITDSSNKRYVTDAQLTVIGNTSGTNTGDQDLSSYATTAASQSYADGKVSDTAYNASSWDNVTGIAPSKNAVRDQTETMLTSIAAKMPLVGGIFTGAVIESVVTLTDAATIAVDATLGNIFTVTLGGNRILGNPTGAQNGQKMIFRIRQDATGSRTLAYDTKFRFGTDITGITLTTTTAKTDYIGVIYHGADDKFDVIAVVKGL